MATDTQTGTGITLIDLVPERQQVQIRYRDETGEAVTNTFEFKAKGELELEQLAHLAQHRQKVLAVSEVAAEDFSVENAQVMSAALKGIVELVLIAPEHVHAALTDSQRSAVVQDFFVREGLIPTQGSPPPTPKKQTGARRSPGSRRATAGTR